MALIEFENLPDTSTPVTAENLNNNFNYLDGEIPDVKNAISNSTEDTYSCSYVNNNFGTNVFVIKRANTISLTWTTGNAEESYEITSGIPTAPTGYTLVGCIEHHFNFAITKSNIYFNDNKWYVIGYNDFQYGGARTLYTTWLYKKND